MGERAEARNTTPDAVVLQRGLADYLRRGARAVAMQVSSHGLDQGRTAGVKFDVGVFTNLTRDHLDYHGTMEAYAEAKYRLFTSRGLRHAVVNLDDAFGRAFAARLRATPVSVTGYGLAQGELRAGPIVQSDAGLRFRVASPWGEGEVAAPVLGAFNAANLLAVVGVLVASGVAFPEALAAVSKLSPVPGRLERVGGGRGPLVVVDYAHTPDALEKALAALRPAVAAGHRLLCVFGCGGERDPGKRPIMGEVASRLADHVIVTSDNPRGEDAAAIADQVLAGAGPGAEAIADRQVAIFTAVHQPAGRHRPRGGQGPRDVPGDRRGAPSLQRPRGRTRRPGGLPAMNGMDAIARAPMMDLDEAALAAGGVAEGERVSFAGVSTDSRAVRPGELFVALAGENHDGHAFVAQAFQRGAVAALVSRRVGSSREMPQVIVDDTRAGLGRLAAAWRARARAATARRR